MQEETYQEKGSIRIAGLLIPLLLFADDMVLVSRCPTMMQRLLHALSAFCDSAGLTVNLDKTVWLVGGEVYQM